MYTSVWGLDPIRFWKSKSKKRGSLNDILKQKVPDFYVIRQDNIVCILIFKLEIQQSE